MADSPTPLNQPLTPIYNEAVFGEAVAAMLDAQPRRIIRTDGREVIGWVWEVYRSIQTRSVRIRASDESGYVYHFNTLDVAKIEVPDG